MSSSTIKTEGKVPDDLNPRVYVGNLAETVTTTILQETFGVYGGIERTDMKKGFAFIEFKSPAYAKESKQLDGTTFHGKRIIVELATGKKERRVGGRGKFRMYLKNLNPKTSWQDLKDFARSAAAGPISFTDVWMERGQKFGVVEYLNETDLEVAMRKLEGKRLDESMPTLSLEIPSDSRKSIGLSTSENNGSHLHKRSRSSSRSSSRDRRGRERSRSRSSRRHSTRERRSRSRSRGRRDRSRSRSHDRYKRQYEYRTRRSSPAHSRERTKPITHQVKQQQVQQVAIPAVSAPVAPVASRSSAPLAPASATLASAPMASAYAPMASTFSMMPTYETMTLRAPAASPATASMTTMAPAPAAPVPASWNSAAGMQFQMAMPTMPMPVMSTPTMDWFTFTLKFQEFCNSQGLTAAPTPMMMAAAAAGLPIGSLGTPAPSGLIPMTVNAAAAAAAAGAGDATAGAAKSSGALPPSQGTASVQKDSAQPPALERVSTFEERMERASAAGSTQTLPSPASAPASASPSRFDSPSPATGTCASASGSGLVYPPSAPRPTMYIPEAPAVFKYPSPPNPTILFNPQMPSLLSTPRYAAQMQQMPPPPPRPMRA